MILLTLIIFAKIILSECKTLLLDENSLNYTIDDICATPQCISIGETIQEKMDSGTQPCIDFYQFACGNFPQEINYDNELQRLQLILDDRISSMLNEPVNKKDLVPVKYAKQLFVACRNFDSNIESLVNEITALGGWPVLNSEWNENSFSLENYFEKFAERGFVVDDFFSYRATYSSRNRSNLELYIGFVRMDSDDHRARESISCNSSSFVINRQFATYENMGANDNPEELLIELLLSTDVLMYLASLLKITTKSLESSLNEYLEFSKKIPRSNVNSAICESEKKTIQELQTEYPGIPWTSIIHSVLKPITVPVTQAVLTNCPICWKHLELLFRSTSKRILANYVMWNLLLKHIFDIDRNLRRKILQKIASEKNIEPEFVEQSYCRQILRKYLHDVVNHMYIKKHVKKDSKQKVMSLVNNIKSVLSEVLTANEWLDETSKTYAVRKVENILLEISFPDEYFDEEYMTKAYESVYINFATSTFFDSLLTLGQYRNEASFLSTRVRWKTTVAMANAYYYPLDNSIMVPAGILQENVYFQNGPEYLNYGVTGAIIGHEFIHALNSIGTYFDENGHKLKWLTPMSELEYDFKSKCFIDQYSKYTKNISEISGFVTLTENLCDNDGTLLAYKAYLKSLLKQNRDHTETETRLPNFRKYSNRQMFWINYASFWCSREKKLTPPLHSSLPSIHSNPRFRVNGVVSNSYEFARDFKCPVNSPMNPPKRCRLLL